MASSVVVLQLSSPLSAPNVVTVHKRRQSIVKENLIVQPSIISTTRLSATDTDKLRRIFLSLLEDDPEIKALPPSFFANLPISSSLNCPDPVCHSSEFE